MSKYPQNPDFLGVAECVCANLRKTTRAVTQYYDSVLKATGVTATQFTLLAALANLGRTAQTELAEALVMDRTTMIRNLKPLVARGLIDVDRPNPRGAKYLSLSHEGRRLAEEALPGWREAQGRMTSVLGEGGWQRLIGDLRLAVSAAQSD